MESLQPAGAGHRAHPGGGRGADALRRAGEAHQGAARPRPLPGGQEPLHLRERGRRHGHGAPSPGSSSRSRRSSRRSRRASTAGLQGTPMVGHPIISTSLQEPVLVIAEPVTDGEQGGGRGGGGGEPPPDLADDASRSGSGSSRSTWWTPAAGSSPTPTPRSRWAPTCRTSRSSGASSSRRAWGPPCPSPSRATGKAIKMLGTYARVPDESGWGVIVQVEEDKAYFAAYDMRRKSLALVAFVTVLAAVLGVLFAGQISQPIQKLAEGARRLAGGDYAHAASPSRARTRWGSSPTPSTRWGARSRSPSRRSARRRRRTRSCSWARSACSPTRSTRRTPTRAATPSASPTTPGARQAPRDVRGGRGEGPPLGHHPRRGQDRDRGQDPAQGGGPDRGGVRDHEAAPHQGGAHPGGRCRCSRRWRGRASCTTRTWTAAAIRTGSRAKRSRSWAGS